MIGILRNKVGPWIVGLVIGFIAFVFVFYGIYTPRTSSISAALAGTVNGAPIHLREFNQAYSRRMEMLRAYGFKDDQIKGLRIQDAVFQELAQRKLMLEQAEKMGLEPSGEEIRSSIREIDAFKKDGAFDYAQYKAVLEANQFTVGAFERQVKEDLMVKAWQESFASHVYVSDLELQREFQLRNDQRKVLYVVLTPDVAKKMVQVSSAEIETYLKDEKNLNLVKSRYELLKDSVHKGKKFEEVKGVIAKDFVASQKTDELKKANESLAKQVLESFQSNAPEAKVNALLKPYNVSAQTTPWIDRREKFLPQVGEANELFKDAFEIKSASAAKPKRYDVARGVLIAKVVDVKAGESSAMSPEERAKIVREITNVKEREVGANWLQKATESAKIKKSSALNNLEES